MGDTVIGFDGSAADDVTVIVLNRTDGGPWQLLDQQDRAELDAVIEEFARRIDAGMPTRPPINPPMHQLVTEWMATYPGPDAQPFDVGTDQLFAAAERRADHNPQEQA